MKVSVVIPAFNPGCLLKDTLESCLGQGGVDLEIVVVNDGSTDGTRSLLDSYGDRIRTRHFEKSHGSGAFGRNHGLEICSGEAVKFLDHDDVLADGTLARELAALGANASDMVISPWGVCSLGEDGRVVDSSRRVFHPPATGDLLDAILGVGKTPFTAAVLYRKSLINSLRWDPEVAMYDDFDFFARAALSTESISVLSDLSYWWRLHPDSFQSRIGRDPLNYFHAERTRARIYAKLQPRLESRRDFSPARRRMLAGCYYKGLRAFARWDPPFCLDVLKRIEHLVPGFRPQAREESSWLIRFLMRVFGIRATLGLYSIARGHGLLRESEA